MPNEANNVPLFKELFNVDLSKGVNERDRPETADPATTLTRVENLYQDQTGAYIKRYGTTVLSSATVGGVAFSSGTKLVRSRLGLGSIANGRLRRYMESTAAFAVVNELPAFVDSAEMVASSGFSATASAVSVAHSSKYSVVVHQELSGTGYTVTIHERASGLTAAKYDLSKLTVPVRSSPKAAFVADRYLHLYYGTATSVYGTSIDTNSALPILESSIPQTSLYTPAGALTILDHAVGADRSFVLHADGGVSKIAAMGTGGTLVDSDATAGILQIASSGTRLWLKGAANLEARSLTTLATVSIAPAAHGASAGGYLGVTSQNKAYVVAQTTPAFGATTIKRITVYYSTATDGTALTTDTPIDGWGLASTPFTAPNAVSTVADRVFIHVVKDNGLTVTTHAIAEIGHGVFKYSYLQSADFYASVPVAASVEPMTGVVNPTVLKYFSQDSGASYGILVPVQTVVRGVGYSVHNLRTHAHADTGSSNFGGATYIGGGTPLQWAGGTPTEAGFVDMPVITSAVGAGTGPTGAYKHIAVFRHVDENGAVTWSRTSSVASVTVANQKMDLVICPAALTLRDYTPTGTVGITSVTVDLYRTAAGGTQYYLCASSQSGITSPLQAIILAATRFYTVTDSMTDADLANQQQLFRQPGTPNAAVDRYPPPCGNQFLQHKDRLFTTDPYGDRVYYSSFFVDGETAWFNPAFSFFVHGAAGPITALASMDGRLIVFKRNGIFIVDGDGPPEGGPSGNEYSPPQRLSTEFGCIDHRSVAITTDGIIYKSDRGVEILTRSLQVKWLGERVQTTVDANPKVCGACIDSSGRYHLALGASDTGTPTQTGVSGVELVYDPTLSAWVISHHSNLSGTYNRCLQDVCRADLLGYGEVVCYADPDGTVSVENAASGLDRGLWYVPWTLETAWIRTGQQARARFSKSFLLAKRQANHKVTISAAYNYVDSYTQVGVLEPSSINAAVIENLMQNLKFPEATSVRLLFQESAPTDTTTYPVGTARGCDVLGIGLEIAQKTGAPKLASSLKV